MKKLLVVIDYQKDFVSGSLGFSGAVSLEPVICEKIRLARKQGDTIAFTFDTHEGDYLTTQEGKNLPIAHCIKGSQGWELYGEVKNLVQANDLIFEKPVFGAAELFDYLRQNPFDEVELCGVVSNICVISNAVLVKTALPEARVVVDANATASNDPKLNQAALDILRSIQVIVLNNGASV